MSQAEDLLSLSLSLSQPLPTDHYTSDIFNLGRLTSGLEPSRVGTPGTSGEGSTSGSSGLEGKKKAKKKKKRRMGESLPEGPPEDVIEGVIPASHFNESTKTMARSLDVSAPITAVSPLEVHHVTRIAEETESDVENVQKESIIVEPFEHTPNEATTDLEQDRHLEQPAQGEKKADISVVHNIAVDSAGLTCTVRETPLPARRAVPLPVRRPPPTILDQFPALRSIPNLIPSTSTLPLPSLRDVQAVGRTTQKVGMALVGTVRDEYRSRMGHVPEGKGMRRQAERRRSNASRRPGSYDSDTSVSDASEARLEEGLDDDEDSEDEVLIDVDDVEGTETWRGIAGVDEAALGVGWMRRRSCKWEQVSGEVERYVHPFLPAPSKHLLTRRNRRFLVTINPTPQTALQIIECTDTRAMSGMNMLHPETVDLANSTLLQTAPWEVVHLPRHNPRLGRRAEGREGNEGEGMGPSAFYCQEVEVMEGLNAVPSDAAITEDDEEILVDCVLLRTDHTAVGAPVKWIFAYVTSA